MSAEHFRKFVYGVKTILHFIRVEKQTLYILILKTGITDKVSMMQL